jgi:copper oxidase (laccase) domain-containing protein
VRAVHGVGIVEATHSAGGDRPGEVNEANPVADGLWSTDPARTLAVAAADCMPILVAVPGRVATVHAGWRGALAGVVENAVRLGRVS